MLNFGPEVLYFFWFSVWMRNSSSVNVRRVHSIDKFLILCGALSWLDIYVVRFHFILVINKMSKKLLTIKNESTWSWGIYLGMIFPTATDIKIKEGIFEKSHKRIDLKMRTLMVSWTRLKMLLGKLWKVFSDSF